MGSDLEAHFRFAGAWEMISPDVGVAALMNELLHGRKGDVEVIIADDLGMLDGPLENVPEGGGRRMSRGRAADIAIVGLGCRFPGATDLFSFWANSLANLDQTREVPADRWPLEQFYDPGSSANDRVIAAAAVISTRRFRLTPVGQGIMPLAVAGGEPEQFLVLDTARAALADAGIDRGTARPRARRGRHRPGQLLQPG